MKIAEVKFEFIMPSVDFQNWRVISYYSINHESSRQIMATSAEVNPNDGRGREFPQNELNSGRGIMVIWWNSDQSCIKILLNFGNKLILKGQLVLQQIHFATKTNHFGTNIWYHWNRISQQFVGVGCRRQKHLEIPIFMLSNAMAMNLELLQNS